MPVINLKLLVAQLCPTETLWTVAHQNSLSAGFSGKDSGVGCRFLLQGILLDPGIKPGSPALQADASPSEPPRKFIIHCDWFYCE